MTQEQEVMVINHSPNYLGSLAFREALDFVFKHDKSKKAICKHFIPFAYRLLFYITGTVCSFPAND
ncbi:MAG: hypothetical protein KBT34_06380 [Prevotella sp.]|nr:hypothetical protein [Candidatus Prevotella equi]